jgi:hypothetical protein
MFIAYYGDWKTSSFDTGLILKRLPPRSQLNLDVRSWWSDETKIGVSTMIESGVFTRQYYSSRVPGHWRASA